MQHLEKNTGELKLICNNFFFFMANGPPRTNFSSDNYPTQYGLEVTQKIGDFPAQLSHPNEQTGRTWNPLKLLIVFIKWISAQIFSESKKREFTEQQTSQHIQEIPLSQRQNEPFIVEIFNNRVGDKPASNLRVIGKNILSHLAAVKNSCQEKDCSDEEKMKSLQDDKKALLNDMEDLNQALGLNLKENEKKYYVLDVMQSTVFQAGIGSKEEHYMEIMRYLKEVKSPLIHKVRNINFNPLRSLSLRVLYSS